MNGQLLPCLFNNLWRKHEKTMLLILHPLKLNPIHIPKIIPKQSDLRDCDSWLYCLYIYILTNIQTYWHILVPVSITNISFPDPQLPLHWKASSAGRRPAAANVGCARPAAGSAWWGSARQRPFLGRKPEPSLWWTLENCFVHHTIYIL